VLIFVKLKYMGNDSWGSLHENYENTPTENTYEQMNLLEKIKKVLSSPSEFFDEIKKEKGIGEAFKYFALLSLLQPLVTTVVLAQGLNFEKYSVIFGGLTFGAGIAVYTILYLFSLVFSFIGVGIIHLSAKLLGGKGDYSATYKVFAYGTTPTLLFGWIPWIGLILALYSYYLELKGLSKLHDVTMSRSFVITLLPVAVIMIILLIMFLVMGIVTLSLIKGHMTGQFFSVISRIPMTSGG